MIFLQCVGSVCRSRKRASYLQGGSEMIMRKNNNRKTKILWTLSPFPSCFLAWCSLRQILIRVNWMWEEEGGVASLWDFQWQLNVSCLQKLSSWSSAPSEPPACSKSPSKPLWTCHKKAHSHPALTRLGDSLAVALWLRILCIWSL